jgi:hypothetical protein
MSISLRNNRHVIKPAMVLLMMRHLVMQMLQFRLPWSPLMLNSCKKIHIPNIKKCPLTFENDT